MPRFALYHRLYERLTWLQVTSGAPLSTVSSALVAINRQRRSASAAGGVGRRAAAMAGKLPRASAKV